MTALEQAGNRYARLVRRYGEEKARKLQDGETIERDCKRKDSGEVYTVRIRQDDGDLRYSMTGSAPWFDTASDAFEARP